MPHTPDLVVFCHLRWNFVWQRPQHLLSRFSRQHRVFYIEEPVHEANEQPHWRIHESQPNLFVCTPVTSGTAPGFHADQMSELRVLLRDLIAQQKIESSIAWFYTPMALPLLEELQPQAVVYDCMDELSAFLHAPTELLELEQSLLDQADLVFTGGPSLYRAKQHRHPHVHCFSSSVDAHHFSQAQQALDQPPEQAKLPHPRLGYFGVIDERFDIDLLAAIAAARPDWQFVMVGPVVKIDPARLPQAANIHYFGQQSYQDLPRFLSGWDVCLLPFARNQSTRFISPTKTLEYMAAEKPIVSTPITDVAEPYSHVVYLGSTPEQFLAGCEQALQETAEQRSARNNKMRMVIQGTSWDRTMSSMEQLLQQAMAKNAGNAQPVSETHAPATSSPAKRSKPESRSPGRTTSAASRSRIAGGTAEQTHLTENHSPANRLAASTTEGVVEQSVVVVGAGPTGLSAAYHLGDEALLVEQNSTIGGWCRSIECSGFTFDYAGHIMFSNDPYVHEMYRQLLGENVHWQDREAWIYSKNVYTRYPFQGALYGLPPEVITECVVGAIEARYGSLQAAPAKLAAAAKPAEASPKGENAHNGTTHGKPGLTSACATPANANAKVEDCCADGVMESTAPLGESKVASNPNAPPANFEEFIYKVWGRGIAKHFAIPYNRKLWSVPLTEMETSWLGGRVPLPDLQEMILGALSPAPKPMGPNARFGYPLRGGFQALMNGFLPLLKGPLKLNTRVTSFSPAEHQVQLSDGTTVHYQHLISTMPLPILVRMAGDQAPPEVKAAAQGLKYISVRCVHLGIGRENITDKHWIYYPEDSIFHRIFVQGNASPHCNPPGGFGLTCEITYDPHYKPLPCDGDELVQKCIEDCRKVGIIREDDPILAATQADMPHAYVIYNHDRAKHVKTIRDWLAQHDVFLAGRYSEWEYYNSDHAFLAGKKAADRVKEARAAADQASPLPNVAMSS